MTSIAAEIGQIDIVMITLDTLRYDAAQQAWQSGQLQTLGPRLGPAGWELRHTPASFTYAAHHAFFSGFLPTPVAPGKHPRLFASCFSGSETTTPETFVFDHATLPEALSAIGYRTICIGGTGFFNPESALGKVLPGLFDESHWNIELGVTGRKSQDSQVELSIERLRACGEMKAFLFVNFSAIHQPNWFYRNGQGNGPETDDLQSHTDALVAVDRALGKLFAECGLRRRTFCIVCSDHGTAYGEAGHAGHRFGHEVIWSVPYAEFWL